jgi:tripartite-type tricarboxylate transporter receptor subunit TctC
MQRRTCVLGVLAAGAARPAGAFAATGYPSRPIRLIVPFSAGGAVDITSRLIAEHLQGELGQNVIVENRTGAGGFIGLDLAAKASPDGYTLAMAATPNTTMAFLSDKPVPYGLDDLTYIGHVARTQLVLVARKDFPADTLGQIIQAARKDPGHVSFGDLSLDGIGSVPLTFGYIEKLEDIKFLRVPYRGEAPIVSALLSNEIDLSIITFTVAQPSIQAGAIKAIAGGSKQRFPTLPRLPTMAEALIPRFETGSSLIVVGPARMPPDVVDRLNAAVNKVIAKPSVQQRMTELGLVRTGGTPAQAKATIDSEKRTWGCVLAATKASGRPPGTCF